MADMTTTRVVRSKPKIRKRNDLLANWTGEYPDYHLILEAQQLFKSDSSGRSRELTEHEKRAAQDALRAAWVICGVELPVSVSVGDWYPHKKIRRWIKWFYLSKVTSLEYCREQFYWILNKEECGEGGARTFSVNNIWSSKDGFANVGKQSCLGDPPF